MTERDKALILSMRESGMAEKTIIRLFPDKASTVQKYINALKQSGEFSLNRLTKKERIINLYNTGIHSTFIIAQQCSCSRRYVGQILYINKLKAERDNKNRKKGLLSPKVNDIIKDLKNGEKMSDISKKYRISRQRVFSIKEKFLSNEVYD